MDAQIGVRIIDDLESSTNLIGANWVRVASFTNDVVPTDNSFDSGWLELTRTLYSALLTPAPEHYFRFKRAWLAP